MKLPVIIICGPPRTGKSTIARILSSRLGATLISTEKFKKKVYKRLIKEVQQKIGTSILVLDGTFYRETWREKVRALAAKAGAPFLIVHLTAKPEILLERDRASTSPRGERAIKIICAEFEPVEADLTCDSGSATPEEIAELALDLLRSKFPQFTVRKQDDSA